MIVDEHPNFPPLNFNSRTWQIENHGDRPTRNWQLRVHYCMETDYWLLESSDDRYFYLPKSDLWSSCLFWLIAIILCLSSTLASVFNKTHHKTHLIEVLMFELSWSWRKCDRKIGWSGVFLKKHTFDRLVKLTDLCFWKLEFWAVCVFIKTHFCRFWFLTRGLRRGFSWFF